MYKRKLLTGILIFFGLLMVFLWYDNRIIGTVHGPEFDTIIIDNVCYVKDYGGGYQNNSARDRGRYLGIVMSGDYKIRVFAVKGDKDRNFLYTLFGYEGCFYARQ